MESDKQILEFFNKLSGATKQQSKNFEVTNKTVEQLLLVETMSAKADKKEQQKEASHKRRILQMNKRKEKEQKGPISFLFGGKEKEEGKGMSVWLLGALGLGAAAIGGSWLLSDDPNAKKIREAIEDKTKGLVEDLKDKLAKATKDAFDKLANQIRSMIRKPLTGTGLGNNTVPGKQSVEIAEKEGTYEEKVAALDAQRQKGGLANLTGERAEANRQYEFMTTGELPGQTERLGGAATSKGFRGIVSGDVTRVRTESTRLDDQDKEDLKELDTLIRDRREINDNIAKLDGEDEEKEKRLRTLQAKKQAQIDEILERNENLVEQLNMARDQRIDYWEGRQTGGPINMKGGQPFTVPGSGIGDSYYQPLPANSFVLNKRASRQFNIDAQRRQGGGHVGKATKHIMKDEALSSLSKGPYPKGQSDFIKPGGTSVKSGTKWGSIKPDTKIYSYIDSVGVPTIGWGSTYYDNIRNGKKKVKTGDVITKARADKALHDNIAGLNRDYAKQIPHWKKMSNSQRAALLSMGYNAPNFFGSFAPGLTAALKRGDMIAAAKNLSWGGPSQTRIRESQAMMRQGPADLSKLKGPKIVGEGRVGQKVVGTGNPLVDNVRSLFGGPRVGDVIKKQSGGPLIVPGHGEGDQVPMHLPEGSFVLNRSASRAMERLQRGGIVGDYSDMERFANATVAGDNPVPEPKIVVVKRRASMPKASQTSVPKLSSGESVNICEMSDTLHRIQSGASF